MGNYVPESQLYEHPEPPVRLSVNTSGLTPLGCAVLIEPYEPEIKKSTLVIPETVGERTALVETRAIVIESGPEAWKDESQPRARPGDKVLITRFAGYMVKGVKDGKQYRLVNDRDIFCGLQEVSDGR